MRQPSDGFTLLEVLIALFIVSLLAVTVSQVVGQRIAIATVVQDRDLSALCARELQARFELEGSAGATQGELRQGGQTCYWRLSETQRSVAGLGQRVLTLYGERGERKLLGEWPVFQVGVR